MLAAKDQYINEASNTIFRLSADEQIQKRCRDREEYYLDIRNYQHEIEKKENELSQKDSIIANQDNEIAHLKELLSANGISY